MSRIIGPLFAGSPLMLLPLVALCLFGAVFVAVVVRLIVQGKQHYDPHARTPLQAERISGRDA